MSFDKAAYWANKGKKAPRMMTVIMCFSCKLRPGQPGWSGQFERASDGQLLHVGCPKPKAPAASSAPPRSRIEGMDELLNTPVPKEESR